MIKHRMVLGSTVGVLSLLAVAAVGIAQLDSEFAARPTWQSPSQEAVTSRLQEYLDQSRIPPDRQAAARQTWSAGSSADDRADVLDRLAAALSKADDRVAELVKRTAPASARGGAPEFAWLADSETPVFVRYNMRLYLARWLVQEGFYDEAVSWMDGLTPTDVAAPETLFFYRAVAHQRLVEPDKALAALNQLLTRKDELPVRYQKLANLMQQDLSALEDDSLDHVARRMEDVRRRLALGHSGGRVQKVENGIVDSLDKMIKEIEDRMQRAQSAAASGANPQQSRTPMQDSRIAELKAPGQVERRDIGHNAGWGDMPAKDREKALQDIGREFPSHYREIIEEYFRRLAAEDKSDR
jgi:hypothetical protein